MSEMTFINWHMCKNQQNEINRGISFTTRIISNDLIERYTRTLDSQELNFMKEKNVQRCSKGSSQILDQILIKFLIE